MLAFCRGGSQPHTGVYALKKTSAIALGMMGVGWYDIGMTNTYTAYARFESHGEVIIEEIDVEARDEREALEKASAELARDYIPGGEIVKVEKRFGIFC